MGVIKHKMNLIVCHGNVTSMVIELTMCNISCFSIGDNIVIPKVKTTFYHVYTYKKAQP